MKPKKIIEVLEKCDSLAETLEMAHLEALDIQKATGTENLDVMHISQAQEIVAMRIGYFQRLKEAADELPEEAKAPGAPKPEGSEPPQ